jgi:hypothetical protein
LQSRTKKDIRGALKNPLRAALAHDADAIFEAAIDFARTEDSELLFLCVLFKATLPEEYLVRLKDPNYVLKIPFKGQTLSIHPVPQPIPKVEVGESSILVCYEYGESSIEFTFKDSSKGNSIIFGNTLEIYLSIFLELSRKDKKKYPGKINPLAILYLALFTLVFFFSISDGY